MVVSELFQLFDSARAKIGILDWGVKMTTLEDGKGVGGEGGRWEERRGRWEERRGEKGEEGREGGGGRRGEWERGEGGRGGER